MGHLGLSLSIKFIIIIITLLLVLRPSSMSIGNTGGTELDTRALLVGNILSMRVVSGGAGAG